MNYMNYGDVQGEKYKQNISTEEEFKGNKVYEDNIIYHIDANSAFLSWEAVYRLQHGDEVDIREIPSVIGGDPKSRHGIVLAKSVKAKDRGVKTGESLMEARMKCPQLEIFPPRFQVYIKSSNAMYKIFTEYTGRIQRYSIDECFLDMSLNKKAKEDPYGIALEIKDRIKNELGFTVSVGVSKCKLLAKMGSEIKKPDAVTTLFHHEIQEKLWPLPVRELFMVGSATEKKLRKVGITTIGELAKCEEGFLKCILKSHGSLVWRYANGIDDSKVRRENYIQMKGIGNSTTVSFDVDSKEEADLVLLSLVETTAMRLRDSGNLCRVVCVHLRSSDFFNYSHRKTLHAETNSTDIIYKEVAALFREMWKGEAIRHIGVRLTSLTSDKYKQLSIMDYEENEKREKIDSVVDEIRVKYGNTSIQRACFLHSGIRNFSGGAGADSYPVMSSIL